MWNLLLYKVINKKGNNDEDGSPLVNGTDYDIYVADGSNGELTIRIRYII